MQPTRRKHIDWAAKTVRLELFVLLVGSALLLAALSLFIGFNGSGATENKQINEKEYQAVFLNIGQVYFGKITKLNDKYLVLNSVFYVNCNTSGASQTCQQNGNNTYTLYKLGVNELHAPEDKMVINQSQIAYWENLKDSSKVVQAIKQYLKNPNAASSSQVQQNGTSGQTPTTTPPAATPATPPASGTNP